MLTYVISLLLLIALLTGAFFILRFFIRVGLDIFDLLTAMWTIKKNNAEFKKYTEEKAKNLEKERALRLKKHRDRELEVGQEEDVEIYSISTEAPSPEQFWQYKIFQERFPLMKAIKEILQGNTSNLLKGNRGIIPVWRARIMAQNKEMQAMRGRGGGRRY